MTLKAFDDLSPLWRRHLSFMRVTWVFIHNMFAIRCAWLCTVFLQEREPPSAASAASILHHIYGHGGFWMGSFPGHELGEAAWPEARGWKPKRTKDAPLLFYPACILPSPNPILQFPNTSQNHERIRKLIMLKAGRLTVDHTSRLIINGHSTMSFTNTIMFKLISLVP